MAGTSRGQRTTVGFLCSVCVALTLATPIGCRPSAQAVVEEVGQVERSEEPAENPTTEVATTEVVPTSDAVPNSEADIAPSEPESESEELTESPSQDDADDLWVDLFDGQSLNNWKSSQFGGEGDVLVEDGHIILDFGQPLTGITYQGKDIPTTEYELRLEAARLDGSDFFCALTFPVRDSHCSFVLGGWGGAVVGISSIDGMDASDNDTTTYRSFQRGTFYAVRVRVTDKLLEAWIDDEQVVNQDIEDRIVSTRPEVDLSKPLGISSFDTKGAVRKIQLRKLEP